MWGSHPSPSLNGLQLGEALGCKCQAICQKCQTKPNKKRGAPPGSPFDIEPASPAVQDVIPD